jgi:hypothetical protein
MKPESESRLGALLACASAGATMIVVAACGGNGAGRGGEPAIPQLRAASSGSLVNCAALTTSISQPRITVTSANLIAERSVTSTLGGVTLAQPAHCLLRGTTGKRTGVDGKPYTIGFEMRLPANWNGRFFHQVNGGAGGTIDTDETRAFGQKLGGSPDTTALMDGFAVLSSDGGHTPDASYPDDPNTGLGIRSVVFGLDPQARRDWGYNMVAVLTPVAKSVIRAAYGRGPDRSYIAGCSNGGRHAMVAASRFANDYDGILAVAPGFNLPKAVVAEVWDSQKLMSIATTTDPVTNRPAIWSSFSANDLTLVSSKVLVKCDALDGVADGMIADVAACQAAFSFDRDVPACAPGVTPDGTCLSPAQKTVLADILRGPRDSKGHAIYVDWPVDSAFGTVPWRVWKTGLGAGPGIVKYGLNLSLGTPTSLYMYTTPPADPAVATGLGTTIIDAALHYDFDKAEAQLTGTTPPFPESVMALMTPPNPTDLSTLRNRGAKIVVVHGVSDAVFSYNDTRAWYDGLNARHSGKASEFAQLYPVPGMGHCGGGPATDKFDFVTPLVNWVEKGQAPESVLAVTRPVSQNNDLNGIPAGRTRPLCAYPKVARYNGAGAIDDARSFRCR